MHLTWININICKYTTQNITFQNQDPVAVLAANPHGQVVRPPSRGAGQDQVDSGLLSLVEQKVQYSNSTEPSRYNQGTVGIENGSNGDSSLKDQNSRLDALDDLIANLSSGSEHSSNSPNHTAWPQVLTSCLRLFRNNNFITSYLFLLCYSKEWLLRWSMFQFEQQSSYSSWRSQQNESDISPSHSSSPRPQTPAFPVLARTPYLNASTPTVQFDLPNERLPPKSPTTQR